jgi:8-oxo-dGTP diphosphatase
MKTPEYTVGFLFDGDYVWLIRKTKPEWQSGKLNGVGGKVEIGETPLQTMTREWKEEAGQAVADWEQFASLHGNWGAVHFFKSFNGNVTPMSMTDEKLERVDIRRLAVERVIPNLRWLIPMALSFEQGETAAAFVVQEVASE